MKECRDCGVDISSRHGRAECCYDCLANNKRKREADRNRKLNAWRTCKDCGISLADDYKGRIRCAPCAKVVNRARTAASNKKRREDALANLKCACGETDPAKFTGIRKIQCDACWRTCKQCGTTDRREFDSNRQWGKEYCESCWNVVKQPHKSSRLTRISEAPVNNLLMRAWK